MREVKSVRELIAGYEEAGFTLCSASARRIVMRHVLPCVDGSGIQVMLTGTLKRGIWWLDFESSRAASENRQEMAQQSGTHHVGK